MTTNIFSFMFTVQKIHRKIHATIFMMPQKWSTHYSFLPSSCHNMLKIHIFIPLPGPFADTVFYTHVSSICFFLGLQMQFDLPSKYNCILNLLILRLKDTFQRQKVSSILLFLNLKILSADKWYLQTLKILISDTFLQEFTEILICNTIKITIADTVFK